ncbi:hypothetical protein ACLB2K_061700 [Fragaria x ananassa]
MVKDKNSVKTYNSDGRTSTGVFLWIAQDEIVSNIESRCAAWTCLPIENGEGLQILHHDHGQKYVPHYDSSSDKADQELGGHRVATLMETIEAKDGIMYDSAKKGFSVTPIKGDALLLFNLLPDATIDQNSVHESCPVIEGEKWAATKWLHMRAFQNFIPKVAGARG